MFQVISEKVSYKQTRIHASPSIKSSATSNTIIFVQQCPFRKETRNGVYRRDYPSHASKHKTTDHGWTLTRWLRQFPLSSFLRIGKEAFAKVLWSFELIKIPASKTTHAPKTNAVERKLSREDSFWNLVSKRKISRLIGMTTNIERGWQIVCK